MIAKVLVSPVRDERENDLALQRIEEIFDAEKGTPEYDELDILTILVHEYERRSMPPMERTPGATLRHYIDRMNLTSKDLEPYIGSKSMVSMVLNNRRPLSLKMIRNLYLGLQIPLELLVSS